VAGAVLDSESLGIHQLVTKSLSRRYTHAWNIKKIKTPIFKIINSSEAPDGEIGTRKRYCIDCLPTRREHLSVCSNGQCEGKKINKHSRKVTFKERPIREGRICSRISRLPYHNLSRVWPERHITDVIEMRMAACYQLEPHHYFEKNFSSKTYLQKTDLMLSNSTPP
jgi:hypothetical protein